MLKKEEILFAIGFDGLNAIIDGTSSRKYRGESARSLADKGLFRAATAAALYDKSDADLAYTASVYNTAAGSLYRPEQLARLFGVSLAENIAKSVLL